jgi:hypothetical protein
MGYMQKSCLQFCHTGKRKCPLHMLCPGDALLTCTSFPGTLQRQRLLEYHCWSCTPIIWSARILCKCKTCSPSPVELQLFGDDMQQVFGHLSIKACPRLQVRRETITFAPPVSPTYNLTKHWLHLVDHCKMDLATHTQGKLQQTYPHLSGLEMPHMARIVQCCIGSTLQVTVAPISQPSALGHKNMHDIPHAWIT